MVLAFSPYIISNVYYNHLTKLGKRLVDNVHDRMNYFCKVNLYLANIYHFLESRKWYICQMKISCMYFSRWSRTENFTLFERLLKDLTALRISPFEYSIYYCSTDIIYITVPQTSYILLFHRHHLYYCSTDIIYITVPQTSYILLFHRHHIYYYSTDIIRCGKDELYL